MGYIKVPPGVDLNISPMPFSDEDRQLTSAIIASFKSTGVIPKVTQKKKSGRKKTIKQSSSKSVKSKATTAPTAKDLNN